MKLSWIYLILCIIGCISCSTKNDDQNEENVSALLPDEIAEVRVVKLAYTDFYHELIANGNISAQNKADLKFEVTENIAAIYVKNGEKVRKGQKIAMLDQFKLQNSLLQTKDNLERAKLELQDVLIGQGYSVKDTANIPEDILQLAKVKSSYDQSLNQYELADFNFRNSVLYAPFDGVVANLFSKIHNYPDAGQPFCTIIDNSRPEVDFMILESELPYIKIGDRLEISPFSVNTYDVDGRVTEINPTVDKNGMVRVKASLNNSGNKLFDGMNVKIRLQRSLGKQLVIPKEALVLRTNKKVVFTLKGEKAQWVYVDTGLENSTSYVFTDGLKEGDLVIYEGNINLAHETPVKVKD
ncbi:MAG: efflux RND transporter periplasmic adaptor subunit [Bacteroidales bacterium]|nr:efflux RND transporter periplasmic adaptor subunit [Bacteroidales bacterium]